jgi:hypothetical protein
LLSDAAQTGICVGVAALLQTASGFVGFIGTFNDDSTLQRKVIEKKGVDDGKAVELANRRRTMQRVTLIVAGAASIVFSALAIAVIAAS